MKTRLLPLLFALILAGCGRAQHAGGPRAYKLDYNEFSVMTYNLHLYGRFDRDRDGQQDDMKPEEECIAIAEVIASAHPDILAIQEIGDAEALLQLRMHLGEHGLVYEHVEHLMASKSGHHMAVLSRYPIVAVQHHTNDVYSIGEKETSVARGFIDIDIKVNEDYTFRLIVAHLKSKIFHELGQTEMRRNEARLLNKHVRQALKESPGRNILVVGDINDSYRSAAMKNLLGDKQPVLLDLRPADAAGDVWTYFRKSTDDYTRFDYALASPSMSRDHTPEKSRVVRHDMMTDASDHRPVVVVFKAVDL